MQPKAPLTLRPDDFMPSWSQYTPSFYYQKNWDEIKFSETGPDESYADKLTEALLAGTTYADLLKMPLPKGLTKESAESIRSWMIFRYLDSRDELPAFPTVADWANHIKAPESYVSGLMNENGSESLLSHLPSLEDGTLQPFISVAAKKLYQEMMPLNRTSNLDVLMPEKAVRQRFTSLAIGHRSALSGLPHPQLVQMIADAVQAFAPKLREYRIAFQHKKEGAFDALLAEVKSRNLSKVDAINFIVYSFLD